MRTIIKPSSEDNSESSIDNVALAEEIFARLSESLASQKVAEVYNHVCFLDAMELENNALFRCIIDDCNGSITLDNARELIQSWRSELKAGDYVDKFSAIDAVCFSILVYYVINSRGYFFIISSCDSKYDGEFIFIFMFYESCE